MTGRGTGLELVFSARCEQVDGAGWACMVCTGPELTPATGHLVAAGGPHHGRMLAVLCGRHASEAGHGEVMAQLLEWAEAGLLSADLGPGPLGVPGVLHREPGGNTWHLDPLPTRHVHGGAP